LAVGVTAKRNVVTLNSELDGVDHRVAAWVAVDEHQRSSSFRQLEIGVQPGYCLPIFVSPDDRAFTLASPAAAAPLTR
jgi:hypothetical protein